jgi:hypothetical protein
MQKPPENSPSSSFSALRAAEYGCLLKSREQRLEPGDRVQFDAVRLVPALGWYAAVRRRRLTGCSRERNISSQISTRATRVASVLCTRGPEGRRECNWEVYVGAENTRGFSPRPPSRGSRRYGGGAGEPAPGVPVGVTVHRTQRPRGQVGPPGPHPAQPSSSLDPGSQGANGGQYRRLWPL